jgi:myo-inositol-1(or 4)-monophosphatase
MSPSPEPESLLEIAVELATGAGELIRTRRGPLDIDTKSTPTDMVTAVDREVEAWLSARIAARRPDDAIFGEKGSRHQVAVACGG